ncbi:30S ribosomal protein S20 [Candidatus Kuenenbacteria bacterium]|nr:30S ribosomal protein S20 [Candidatus Kuenenbacteria bacterium]
MPQLQQAKKALKKSQKRAARNKAITSTVKTLVKKSRQAIERKEAEAETLIKQTIQKIDKAAQKGIIKKNTAARKKSRLMKGFNKSKSSS